jgi:hypothetical protein
MTAISLPPIKPDLDKLLDAALETAGETDRFDFKEVLDLTVDEHKIRLVRAVGAFSNTDEGGFLLIGISDDRRIVGVTQEIADAYDQSRVHKIVAQYLAPPPAIQVRHHERNEKHIIVIEIPSFQEVPSVVRQSATFGQEKIFAGTFLFRNRAAQSAVLTAENDLRSLCDTLVKRRASAFVELVQRGTLGRIPSRVAEVYEALRPLQERANKVWQASEGAKPFIEVNFCSEYDLRLTPEQLKKIIPGACIKTQHGFPLYDVSGVEVHGPTAWGWYGRIPFADLEVTDPHPSYLWLLDRAGVFLDREDLWEDAPRSVIPGGIGLFHVIGKIILAIRFVNSFASLLSLADTTRFRVGVSANNVRGRYLENENRGLRPPFRKQITERVVESHVELSLAQLRASPAEVALTLMEEIAWQCGRDDLRRYDLGEALKRAPVHLGSDYKL